MKRSPWPVLALLCLSSTRPQAPTAAPSSSPDTAGAFEAAVADYRAGRFEPALTTFRLLAAEAGDGAAPELLGNLALAALRQRRPAEAEAAARRLLELDAVEDRSLGQFLLAQAAFERARTAELAARLPDAEPGIWQSAVDAAEQALTQWLAASRTRGDWPAAVRNAERAARKLAELRARRDASEQQSKTEQAPAPKPPEPVADSEEQAPDLTLPPLSAAEVRQLRERLQQKEREKRALRRTTNRVQQLGERDW
ncbi:MAG: hypothetical protein KDC98_20755 [Planctomycetes bacterium]|nr:hypothetical protein [Planctomycetota bacterium]